jgi:hypothetical protein
VVGDDDAEDGVAQELEPLVRVVAGVLGAPAAVAQGALEEGGVTEPVTEPLRESSERVPGAQLPPSRPNT